MIWFTLILFVASFSLSIVLAPKPHLENARAGALKDLQFPHAREGDPVPMIYGRVRLRGPNTLWYGHFRAAAIKKKVKTGLFSSKKVTTGYRYYVGFHLSLGLGPGMVLRKIWVDEKKLLWSGTASGDGSPISINKSGIFGGTNRGGGFSGSAKFYSGSDTHTPNAYLESVLGSGEVPGYGGKASIVFERPYIGTSPTLRPLHFELERYPDPLSLGDDNEIDDDINPMSIIVDVLTSEWGGEDIDISNIDTAAFTTVATTLASEGQGMSLIVGQSTTGREVIEEVLRQVDGILYQDPETGKIAIRLIRADYDEESLPVFNAANVVNVSRFSRTAWSETINQIRVVYQSRTRDYESAGAIVQDMANIGFQGRLLSTTLQFPGCTKPGLANILASRELSQLGVPLFRATVEVTREATSLRPGDPFILTWPDYNISNEVMRVQKFDLGELLLGRIVMECIQDRFAVSTPVYADPDDTLWGADERTAIDITEYKVFESPYFMVERAEELTGGELVCYFWALARNPDGMHGYDWLTSEDNFATDIITEISQAPFPDSATLQGDLDYDTGQREGYMDKITVENLYPENFEPEDSTESNMQNHGHNLIMIGTEFLMFENVTDNGDGTWDLENVRRAVLDSSFESHAVGAVVYFINDIVFESENPWEHSDNVAYKFLTFTDKDAQDHEDVGQSSINTAQRWYRPMPPDYMLLDSIRWPLEIISPTAIAVNWDRRTRKESLIDFYDDGDDTEEGSTTYRAEFRNPDDTMHSYVEGTEPLSLTVLPDETIGFVHVRLYAKRDGSLSFTYDYLYFFYADYPALSSNLVSNPGFESGLSNWTSGGGSATTPSTTFPLQPRESQFLLMGGTSNERYQDITTGAPVRERAAVIHVYRGIQTQSRTAQVIIEQRTAVEFILDTVQSDLASPEFGKWELLRFYVPILSNCDHVRIRLIAPNDGTGFEQVSMWNNTDSVANGFQYDNITGLTARGAWALRKVISGYSGALVKLRDPYDDSEFDVGADADGNLEPFFSRGLNYPGEVYVVRLYDQTGNGQHLEAPSQATQPPLMFGMRETGRPHIWFAVDSDHYMRDITASTSRTYMQTRPNAIGAFGDRQHQTHSGEYFTIPSEDGVYQPRRWGVWSTIYDFYWTHNETNEEFTGAPDGGHHIILADYENGNIYLDNYATPADSFTAEDITYPDDTRLGIAGHSTGNNFEGAFCELCIYTGDIAQADRQTMMEDLADYWFQITIDGPPGPLL